MILSAARGTSKKLSEMAEFMSFLKALKGLSQQTHLLPQRRHSPRLGSLRIFFSSGLAAMHLAERIGPLELSALTLRLGQDDGSRNSSPFTLFSSMASIGSVRGTSTYYPLDVCFIIVHGEELRLVIYAIVQSTVEDKETMCLVMLSGDALSGKEASVRYLRVRLPEQESMAAYDIACEGAVHLEYAVQSGDYDAILNGITISGC
jgi:hypothetical protein